MNTTRSIARRLTILPAVIETKENSVLRCAWRRDITELFMSPKSVKTPVMRIPTSAIGELYPGKKNPIASDRKMMQTPKNVRSVRMFPTILCTFAWSHLCSEISRTVIV